MHATQKRVKLFFFAGGECCTLKIAKHFGIDWPINDWFKLFPLRNNVITVKLVFASSLQEVFAILYLSNSANSQLCAQQIANFICGTCSADFLGSSCYSMFNPLGYFYSMYIYIYTMPECLAIIQHVLFVYEYN